MVCPYLCLNKWERSKIMEWLYPKRRGQTISPISVPSLHFLMIFGIVVSLLWFSQTKEYKSQLHHAAINFHLFLLLLPILLIFLIISYSKRKRLSFPLTKSDHNPPQQATVSASSRSVAALMLLLLVLLWYQSSFQSKWFGFWKSKYIHRILVNLGNFITMFFSLFL